MSAVEESGTRATYAYGPSGMREIKQLVSAAGTTTVTDAWVGMGLMAERVVTPTSTTEYRYVYGPDLLPVELLVKQGSGSWVSYAIHCDAGGSVTGISDEDRNTVARYAYDPWGSPIEDATHATDAIVAAQPLRYRGYYWDAETSHYYLPARYYDPELGRFLSVDPAPPSAGEPMSLNRYVYCVDDPVNLLDRDGREPHGLGMADGYTEDGFNYGHLPGQGSMKDANDEAPRIAQEAKRRRERLEAYQRAKDAFLAAVVWASALSGGDSRAVLGPDNAGSVDLNVSAVTPRGVGFTGGVIENVNASDGSHGSYPYLGVVAAGLPGPPSVSAMAGPMQVTPGSRQIEASVGFRGRGFAAGFRSDGNWKWALPEAYLQGGAASNGVALSWFVVSDVSVEEVLSR